MDCVHPKGRGDNKKLSESGGFSECVRRLGIPRLAAASLRPAEAFGSIRSLTGRGITLNVR
jgi:hypothetical protein